MTTSWINWDFLPLCLGPCLTWCYPNINLIFYTFECQLAFFSLWLNKPYGFAKLFLLCNNWFNITTTKAEVPGPWGDFTSLYIPGLARSGTPCQFTGIKIDQKLTFPNLSRNVCLFSSPWKFQKFKFTRVKVWIHSWWCRASVTCPRLNFRVHAHSKK